MSMAIPTGPTASYNHAGSNVRDAAKQHLIAREIQQRPDVMIVRCA
jgi:hypothetical protein